MKKEDILKPRFAIQHDNHHQALATVLCSMMEHQSLVDLAIRCGNNTIHAHKTVLAANSSYFKDHLEKNVGTEQIIINGLDFTIVKAIIEYIYCGETNVLEEQFKHFVAAASMFKLRGLQCLESEVYSCQDVLDLSTDKSIHIPPPTFLTKKPKYSSTYVHFNNAGGNNVEKSIHDTTNGTRKNKRKYIRSEAERACAKEAAASRMALEALKKELATTQVSSFVIEESCTETTVENFIPHNEETFIENLNQLTSVPVQVVNYNLNPPISSNQLITPSKIVPYMLPRNLQKSEDTPSDKLKHIIGDNMTTNVEIMFKTSDGTYINVTDEMLQDMSQGELQYQVIDENGQASEMQELTVEDKEASNKFVDKVHTFVNAEHCSQESENSQNSEKEKVNVDASNKLAYNDFKSDYDRPEFMITEHSGSCPIFIPTSLNSRDPLSEACDIAENLSNTDDAHLSFDAMNGHINESEHDDVSEKLDLQKVKYLMKSKPTEQNLLEFSPRKLRSARQVNLDASFDSEESDKKRFSNKKKKAN